MVVEPYTHEDARGIWGKDSERDCDSPFMYMVSFVDDQRERLPESGIWYWNTDQDVSEDPDGYVWVGIASKHR